MPPEEVRGQGAPHGHDGLTGAPGTPDHADGPPHPGWARPGDAPPEQDWSRRPLWEPAPPQHESGPLEPSPFGPPSAFGPQSPHGPPTGFGPASPSGFAAAPQWAPAGDTLWHESARPRGSSPAYTPLPHDRPQPHHHLLRTPRWRWWRPVLGLLLAAALSVVAILGLFLFGAVAALAAGEPASSIDAMDGALALSEPLGLLVANLSLAILIPPVLLAVLVVHRERPGWVTSVTGALRAWLLWRFTVLALLVSVLAYAVVFLIPPPPGEAAAAAGGAGGGGGPGWLMVAVLLLVVLLSTPLQAAAEEYVFRGYLTQAVAGWIPRPAVALAVAGALSAVLFAVAHGSQDAALFSSRLGFAVVATWTVWRTGGLEAAIAVHTANNVVVLALAVVSGDLAGALEVSETAWRYTAVDLGSMVVFAALVGGWCRRLQPDRVSVVDPSGRHGHRVHGASGSAFETHGRIGYSRPGAPP